MENKELEQFLRDALADFILSQNERIQLRELIQTLNSEQSGFLRNRAFDLVREQLVLKPQNLQLILKWLETVIKTLDAINQQKISHSSAYFSPGESCRETICTLLSQANQCVDICVFTIADDAITEAILKAHQRQIQIRIITDNDKSDDVGSDIDYLLRKGISIVADNSPYHMHHKFAIFDNRHLLNGSFNWTRSASLHNCENILITNSPELLKSYQQEFTKLWERFN